MEYFKVRNEKGDEFQVEAAKLNEAVNDGFLPMVTNGKQSFRVSPEDYEKAKADGYEYDMESDMPATAAGIRGFGDVLTFGHMDEAAGAVDAAWEIATTDKEIGDWEEVYKENRDRYRDLYKEAAKHQPGAFTTGQLAGGVTQALSPIGKLIGGKIPGAGSPLTKRMAGAAGVGLAEGGLYGAGTSEAELLDGEIGEYAKDIGIGAGTGATISAAVPAGLEGLGKTYRGAQSLASKIVPGSAGAMPFINKMVSKMSSVVPGQGATSAQIEELLTQPGKRRELLQTDIIRESQKALPVIEEARKQLKKGVGEAYEAGESVYKMQPIDRKDIAKESIQTVEGMVRFVQDEMEPLFAKIARKPQFYSSHTKQVYKNVEDIINTGGARATKDIPMEDIASNQGLMKDRMLQARRHLDDLMENKNWERLNDFDQEAIRDLRKGIDKTLKKRFPAGRVIEKADALYSEYMDNVGNFFKYLEKQGEEGANLTKVFNEIRSGTTRGIEFDNRIKKLQAYLESANMNVAPKYKNEANKMLTELRRLRRLSGFKQLADKMDYAGGGPTSQGVNTVAQILMGAFTGGLSLAAFPVTNPAGYMKLLDRAVLTGFDKIPGKFLRGLWNAGERGSRAMILHHMLSMEKNPEYRQAFEQSTGGDAYEQPFNLHQYIGSRTGIPMDRLNDQQKSAIIRFEQWRKLNPDAKTKQMDEYFDTIFPGQQQKKAVDKFIGNDNENDNDYQQSWEERER